MGSDERYGSLHSSQLLLHRIHPQKARRRKGRPLQSTNRHVIGTRCCVVVVSVFVVVVVVLGGEKGVPFRVQIDT